MSRKGGIRMLIAGDSSCGKTSMWRQLSENKFSEEWTPHEYINHTVKIKAKGKRVTLDIWETPIRVDVYDSFNFSDVDVLLISFSIDKKETLESVVPTWIPELTALCPTARIVLVGNKIDLRDEGISSSPGCRLTIIKEKALSPEDGQEVAYKIGAYAYRECSAKLDMGIDSVFQTGVEAAKAGRIKRKKFSFSGILNTKK